MAQSLVNPQGSPADPVAEAERGHSPHLSTHPPTHPPAGESRQSPTEERVSPQAARETIIQLRNVGKTYRNGSQALTGVNLDLKKGDFYLVTGPSGSGKSTLLKLLYGEERASSGEVKVDGCDLNTLRGDRLARLRRRIGVVFQDYKLISRRTVAENVAFVLWAQGYGRAEVERRLQPALKMVGLQHKAQAFPEELSGGEQQRVSIARAIVGTPPILLADEPTGNLDPDNSRQILNILKRLNQIGITILVTTHDESLIRSADLPILQVRNGQLSLLQP
ncbi:cell division ATP-binding protein FtsE [Alkalinema sp. FACHB-956]|uniref:cell division ATP-binding protein FtsE n=1 Tax=Alkalinema sp. FACHB-956 TaxID=2692768 RepID=UPI0016863A9D|nr:cell division ATP-binding protein FtsE [Alkalinema sp. FACHB-956]MBD2327786.1 cell division ATP-binding protein FtsE [Alkalinema sp. FACHB-956]